jgi:tetratricopeptide (TPR) repeat protein
MPVRVQCPNPDCRASFSVLEGDAPRFRRCPQCGWELSGLGTAEPNLSASADSPRSNSSNARAFAGLTPGSTFASRYEIVKPLGRGGMGVVYLAKDTRLGRDVALKIPYLWDDEDPEFLQRFNGEARAAAKLHHPNICPIFDVGDHDGQPYLTMAYLDGVLLSNDIKQRQDPLEPRDAIRLVRKLAKALHAAHQKGVIHRDLKPSNIIIDGEIGPILMDFGLARREDLEETLRTHAGHQLGTPAYMPLEQFQGRVDAIGPRSDIYSLGVILFELLTGRRPYEGNAFEIHVKLLRTDPPSPSSLRAGLDPAIDAICQKSMAREPEDRYASIAELDTALGASPQLGGSRSALVANNGLTSTGQFAAPAMAQSPDRSEEDSSAPSRDPFTSPESSIPPSDDSSLSAPEAIPPKRSAEPPPIELDSMSAEPAIRGRACRVPGVLGPFKLRHAAGVGIVLVFLPLLAGVFSMMSGQYSRHRSSSPPRFPSQRDRAEQTNAEAKSVAADQDIFRSRLGQGESLLRLGQYDRALEEFDAVIRLDPKSAVAFCNRGAARAAKNDNYHAMFDFDEAIRLDPKLALAYASRARIHLAYVHPDQALGDYEQAHKLDATLSIPDDVSLVPAYIKRGNVCLGQAQWDLAIAAFERATALKPNDPRAHAGRGEAYRQKKEHDRAIANFTEAIKLNPRAVDTLAGRGETYLAQGRLRPSIDDFSQAISLQSTELRSRCGRGLAYYYAGDFDAAISDADAVLASKPDWVEALLLRAVVNAENARFGPAIADCTRALKLQPRSLLAYAIRALSRERANDYQHFEADAKAALAIAPQSAIELNYRSVCFAITDKHDDALGDLGKALRAIPGFVVALGSRGHVYWKIGDSTRALIDVEKAISLSPRFDWLYSLRGRIRNAQGNSVRAIDDLDTAIRIGGANKPQFLRERSIVLSRTGEYSRAIADCDEAIRLRPNSPSLYLARGLALSKNGDVVRANDDFQRVIQMLPNNAMVYTDRGLTFSELKQYDRAIADYGEALRIDPTYSPAYKNRGNAYSDKKVYDRAIADYDEAIRLDPNFARAYSGRAIVRSAKKDYDRAITDLSQAIKLMGKNSGLYLGRGFIYQTIGNYNLAIADLDDAIRLDQVSAIA